ncbi:MAG: Asp-tRNA(Asn)/Glu-tRNA(Gln) amidotransferase subunit GatB [Candidatus Kapabacteria bacterium]|nr:Asp-tRNA(Asn)/Glu-tRNA(Gln) amidotransferase subunit GatB [Candidatus Kapabacteria bacterium]
MTTRYEAIIGLEVHAQLKTQSKAFCSCPTAFGAAPNVNVCPICLGHPGALPVLNRSLVEYIIRMGLATNCTIRERSSFSRKNYFYADLPKGYQISQYTDPICFDGTVEIETDTGVRNIGITRIHMEEDSGKSIHDLDIDTLVDLNRSGVPLIEIVSEPDIRSAHEAYMYLQQIRQTVIYLGICDGNMEEGSLRCDANVSVRPLGQEAFNTKTEIKNLNSFRNVEKAIEFEIARQINEYETGGSVQQVTMMWDASKQATRVMRTKEGARDYRYFPEPDLVHVVVDEQWKANIAAGLPELGLARKRRFIQHYGLPAYDAGILVDDASVADWYEQAVSELAVPATEAYKAVSNWIMTDILRIMGQKKCAITEAGVTPKQLAGLIDAVQDGTISTKIAKDIFPELLGTDATAAQIIAERGLAQVSDEGTIRTLVADVLQKHADTVTTYKAGKTNLFGFFVGQVLKASGGSANPALVSSIMKEALDAIPAD